MSGKTIIKRYRNRKLYNTNTSTYVTLDDIAEMVRTHQEIQVIENDTEQDITSATLAQIIFESEKKRSGFLTRGELNQIIRNRSQRLKDFLEERLHIDAGPMTWDDNLLTRLYDDIEDQLRSVFSKTNRDPEEASSLISRLMGSPQRALEEFFDRTEEKFNEAIRRLTNLKRVENQFDKLNARLDELDERLAEFRKRRESVSRPPRSNGEGAAEDDEDERLRNQAPNWDI